MLCGPFRGASPLATLASCADDTPPARLAVVIRRVPTCRSQRSRLLGLATCAAVFLAAVSCSSSPDVHRAPRTASLVATTDATGLSAIGLVGYHPSPLPGADPDGVGRLAVHVGGLDRAYLLAPARRIAPRARPALLIYLPSANTLLTDEYVRYRLDALRDHGMTVLVAGPWAGSWNAGRCCGLPHRRGVDDVAAVSAMRDDALQHTDADPSRVVVLGHSAGALLAWRLACTRAFTAVAIVAVGGTLVSSCAARSPDSAFLAVNGGRDTTVPLMGSTRVVPLLGVAPPSVRSSFLHLGAASGCHRFSVVQELTELHGCRDSRLLQLRIDAQAGHSWAELDGTRVAAAFLGLHVVGIQ